MKYRCCRRPAHGVAPRSVKRSALDRPPSATHSPARLLAQPLTQSSIRPPARPLTRSPAHPPCPAAAQLMYKLRKELGETDFNKIFNNVKVKGFDIDY
jgi:hypothetical protein